MEANLRWAVVTAVAPIAWGSNYYVTRHFLPVDLPFWGGAGRALPAGLVLLALARELPRGRWWWQATGLGILNVGAFFVLVYASAQLLPSNLAAPMMALSAAVMMLLAWALVAERPRLLSLAGAAIGVAGVGVMLLGEPGHVNGWGVLAAVVAMVMSSLGFILTKRWLGSVRVLAATAWQLVAGGLVLLPVAVLVEGAPPPLGARALIGFGYVSIVATAIAYLAWFAGLRHLSAAAVGLVGLLNPVAGVVLGTLVAGEAFGWRQLVGIIIVLGGVVIGQPRPPRRAASRARRRAPDPGPEVDFGPAPSAVRS